MKTNGLLKRSLLGGLALALCFVLNPGRAVAVAKIEVGSYTVPATPLEPFLVPIVISGAENVDFWQFTLSYDSTDLKINDPAVLDPSFLGRPVTEGEFFLNHSLFNAFNPGFILLDPSDTTKQIGTLLDVNNRFGADPQQGVYGDGVLAYVEFVAIGDGNSVIEVTDSRVASAAVPEPSTLLLFASGLLMLRVGRTSRRMLGKSH